MAAYLSVASYPNALDCVVSGFVASYAFTRNIVWQAYLNGTMVVNVNTTAPPYSSGAEYVMTGLINGQTYYIQVGVYSEDWQEQFALLYGSGTPSEPTPPPGTGHARIYSGGWHTATPYVYGTKNGVTKWWPATEYIYNGGWQ